MNSEHAKRIKEFIVNCVTYLDQARKTVARVLEEEARPGQRGWLLNLQTHIADTNRRLSDIAHELAKVNQELYESKRCGSCDWWDAKTPACLNPEGPVNAKTRGNRSKTCTLWCRMDPLITSFDLPFNSDQEDDDVIT